MWVCLIKYDCNFVFACTFFVRLSLHMNSLIFGWNGLRKVPYISQILSAPTGAIFRGTNNKLDSHKHFHKKQDRYKFIFFQFKKINDFQF